MSITSATDRLPSPRRVQPRHMVGAVLLAIGLLAVVVAIAISSTTSIAGRPSAGPRPIGAPRSHVLTGLIGAPDLSVPGRTFRDPVTHALLPVATPTAPPRETGHGPQ